jgi:hypothetical protein
MNQSWTIAAAARWMVGVMGKALMLLRRQRTTSGPETTTEAQTHQHPHLMLVERKQEPEEAPEPAAKPIAQRSTPKTLDELLVGIDEAFAGWRLPYDKMSTVARDSVAMYRRLGVHVPAKFAFEDRDTAPRVETHLRPGVLAIALPVEDRDDDDIMASRYLCATRLKKLPPLVAGGAGVPYVFDVGYSSKGKPLAWLQCHVCVAADGTVTACKELLSRTHHITAKSPQARRRFGRSIPVTYRAWSSPWLALISLGESISQRKLAIEWLFADAVQIWAARESQWSVAVYKNGERVTFGIDPRDTKTFFADRDKSAKTPSGATKKIIHHVREHARNNGAQVREHVRGLREFDWKAFRCVVNAPAFTGKLATTFQRPAESFDDELEIPAGMIAGSKLGVELARFEDRDFRAQKRARV